MKFKMDSTVWGFVWIVAIIPCAVKSELSSEYISHSLLLTCATSSLAPGSQVISIVINDVTSSPQRRSDRDDTLAWMTSDGVPQVGKGGEKNGREVFLSGTFDKSETTASKLEVLFLQYNATSPAVFECKVSWHGDQAKIETQEYRVQVDPLEKRKEEEEEEERKKKEKEEEEEEEDVRLSTSGKDSDFSAKKQSTRSPERGEDTELRSGSVLQPTVLETGTPMSVVIAMLVLITLLFVITSILLLQKFKEKCGGHTAVPYPPPHYALAREGLEAWGEHMGGGGMKGSPSLHTVVGLRSHYSLPRPLHPPPPPPKQLLRSKSRESEYAGGPCGIPPGMTRSFHNYTTPYDAIVQDEDGELSLLNTSSHCDVTPALPPEQAAEPTYKVPRVEAEVQTQGQGHSMYVCGVANGAPTFELE